MTHAVTRILVLVLACLIGPASAAPDTATTAKPAPKSELSERRVLLRVLRDRQYSALDAYLSGIQQGYESGREREWSIQKAMAAFSNADPALTEPINEWRTQHPQSYVAATAAGLHYLALAWAWRGHAFINKTHPYRIEQMDKHLAEAKEFLVNSLALAAKPVVSLTALINIEKTGGRQETARKWLDEATRVDSANREPRLIYISMLQPRWGGSHQAMDAFAAEVAATAADEPTRKLAKRLASASIGDQATQLWENKDLAGALRRYEEAEQKGGQDDYAMSRAQIQADVGQTATALAILDEILARHPDHPMALYQRSQVLAALRRGAESVVDLKAAAEFGHIAAWTELGLTLLDGPNGIAVDTVEGIKWLERAAFFWDRKAAYNAGITYEKGLGAPTDFAKAVHYHRIAVAQDHGAAQNNLGLLLWYGRGVKQDQDEAIRLWQLAAKKGIWQGKHNLNYFLTPAQRAKLAIEDPKQVRQLFDRQTLYGVAAAAFLTVMLIGLVIRRRWRRTSR